jgi:D-3-phosphoglycerate dehydrogenase
MYKLNYQTFPLSRMSPFVAIPGSAVTDSPRQVGISISPTSPLSIYPPSIISRSDSLPNIRLPKVLHPIDNEDLRLLVLENISQDAVTAFREQGFHVDHYTRAMSEDELVEKIGSYHAIGIRSKTKITRRVIEAASKVRR